MEIIDWAVFLSKVFIISPFIIIKNFLWQAYFGDKGGIYS